MLRSKMQSKIKVCRFFGNAPVPRGCYGSITAYTQVQQCSRQNHIAHIMAKSTVSKSSPAILPAKKLSAEKVGLPLHGCVQHANPAAIPCVAETDESLFRNIKFRVQLASAQNGQRSNRSPKANFLMLGGNRANLRTWSKFPSHQANNADLASPERIRGLFDRL